MMKQSAEYGFASETIEFEPEERREKTGQELMAEEKELRIISGTRADKRGSVTVGDNMVWLGKDFGGDKIILLRGNVYGIIQEVDGQNKIVAGIEITPPKERVKPGQYLPKDKFRKFNPDDLPADLADLQEAIEDYKNKFKKGYIIESRGEKTEASELEKVKIRFIEYLEKKGMISYGKNGEIICELRQIQSLNERHIELDQILPYQIGRKKSRANWQEILLDIFKDKKVLSTQDYQKKSEGESDLEEKPLIYMPTRENAFDAEKIKQAQFYLTVSDIPGRWKIFNRSFQKQMGISAEEAEVAVRIYHPNFGNGFRNNKGTLMVRKNIELPDLPEYTPISAEWLSNARNRGIYSGLKQAKIERKGKDVPKWNSPKEALAGQEFKNLRESELLKVDDFRQMESSQTAELFRDQKLIRKKGDITATTFFRNPAGERESLTARYTLGTEFEGKTQVRLAPNLYGIIDETKGFKRVTHVFEPASPEVIRQKRREFEAEKGRKALAGSVSFGKRDERMPKPTPFSETKLSPKREDETTEEYAERMAAFNAVREYNKLQQISADLSLEAKVGLHGLSLREQNALTAYAFENEENYKKVIGFAKKYGREGLQTFLACEYGREIGDKIIGLEEKLSPDDVKKIFIAYNKQVDQAKKQSEKVLAEIRQDNPENVVMAEDIRESLMGRGKDLLVELHQSLATAEKKDRSKLVEKFIAELEKETPEQKAIRTQFKKIASIFGRREVSLEDLKKSQSLVLRSLEQENGTANLLRTLQRMDRLKPIPEIHWRVDRSIEEYDRRLGLNVTGFLQEIAPSKGKKILLEFGPGSGLAKKQRARAEIGGKYNDFAMADRVYYPVETVVSQLIDFKKIENELNITLIPEEKRVLTEFIYKTIYIKQGQTAEDDFEYDQETIEQIADNPNHIKAALLNAGEKLAVAEAIPQTISSRDEQGRVIYPYKVSSQEQSPQWQKAKAAFAKNPQLYLRDDFEAVDVCELIEAFPAGTMIGDFGQTKKINPDQIDVALGVRSTVYLREREYIDFLADVSQSLKTDGVYIDDSVRDNDGWYYRIGELDDFKKMMAEKRQKGEIDYQIDVSVVLGPGFPGEDHREDQVPLAFIITKDGSYDAAAQKFLEPGCKIIKLEDLVKNTRYLSSLDKTGHTLEMAEYKLPAAA